MLQIPSNTNTNTNNLPFTLRSFPCIPSSCFVLTTKVHMPQVRHLREINHWIHWIHRWDAIVVIQGTVPWEASNSLIREPSSLLPTKFLSSGCENSSGLSNFCIKSHEKFFKSQRRGDESRATVHLSNVTEYSNCFWGSWKVAAMVILNVAPGLCHLIGQHVTIVIMACHAKTATSPLQQSIGCKQIVGAHLSA